MSRIRTALTESVHQLRIHGVNFEKLLQSRPSNTYIFARREFYKMMVAFHTIYDHNSSMVKYYYDKLETATENLKVYLMPQLVNDLK